MTQLSITQAIVKARNDFGAVEPIGNGGYGFASYDHMREAWRGATNCGNYQQALASRSRSIARQALILMGADSDVANYAEWNCQGSPREIIKTVLTKHAMQSPIRMKAKAKRALASWWRKNHREPYRLVSNLADLLERDAIEHWDNGSRMLEMGHLWTKSRCPETYGLSLDDFVREWAFTAE